jgi:hypothetical protein
LSLFLDPPFPGSPVEHSRDTPPAFTSLWSADLGAAAGATLPWLWHGYVAPGLVTLLTSQWKSGKTTLLSILLARIAAGGQLAGLAVRPGRAAVLSEEGPFHWFQRSQRLHFGDHLCWFCRPFRGKPRPDDWLAFLDHLLVLRTQHPLDLFVIDPLASFLPGRAENLAGSMLDALLPLQRLTAAGLAVLILHHPCKGESAAGQAARGSGALPAYADILIEMRWAGVPTEGDRRRRLLAYSRFDETTRRLVIELNADGADYLCHGDIDEDDFSRNWQVLRGVLEDACLKLTRRQILEQWPGDHRPPDDSTLWRWLTCSVARGLVKQDGLGRRSAPYRYWLPEREAMLFPDLPPLTGPLPWQAH